MTPTLPPEQEMPEFAPGIRRSLERDLHDAEYPVGLSAHDGRARVNASHVRNLLSRYDELRTHAEALQARLDRILANPLRKLQNIEEGIRTTVEEQAERDALQSKLSAAYAAVRDVNNNEWDASGNFHTQWIKKHAATIAIADKEQK